MAEVKHHAALHYTGTAAERVALGTTPMLLGAEFIESDTNNIWQWDGVAWKRLDGAGGGTVLGGGAAPQVAYWTGGNTIAGDAGLTYNAATDTITLAGGIVLTGGAASVITVNDNVANALTIVDAGAIEYLRLITTDAQPVVVWNEGGADVDFRVEGVGVADALFVRGSDGYVGIGTNAPERALHVGGGTTGIIVKVDSGGTDLSALYLRNIAISATSVYQVFHMHNIAHKYFSLGMAGGANNRLVICATQDLTTPLFTIVNGGNVGIGTIVPGQILDCNDGSGNMIADGYDNHPSWLSSKVDPVLMTHVIERLKKVRTYSYKRKPYVSADELADLAMEKFSKVQWDKAFRDGYYGGKMFECPDPEILAFLDEQADKLRAERQSLPKWQRKHYSLAIDDLLDTFPDVISRNDEGDVTGYSLNSYVGVLHGAISELINRLELLETLVA